MGVISLGLSVSVGIEGHAVAETPTGAARAPLYIVAPFFYLNQPFLPFLSSKVLATLAGFEEN